jgi:hypothetical protein
LAAGSTFSASGVPSTGQKLNLSANSSRQVEHCFIFILAAASSQAKGLSKAALSKSFQGNKGLAIPQASRPKIAETHYTILCQSRHGRTSPCLVAALLMRPGAKRLTRRQATSKLF